MCVCFLIRFILGLNNIGKHVTFIQPEGFSVDLAENTSKCLSLSRKYMKNHPLTTSYSK